MKNKIEKLITLELGLREEFWDQFCMFQLLDLFAAETEYFMVFQFFRGLHQCFCPESKHLRLISTFSFFHLFEHKITVKSRHGQFIQQQKDTYWVLPTTTSEFSLVFIVV